MTKEIQLHPLCTLFPRMAGDAFATLVADIKANGLREPITTHGGLILDGGNRYRACVEAGVTPKFRKFDGDNVVTFVLSENLQRRHLTPSQASAITSLAQDWAEAHVAHRNKGDSSHPSVTVAQRAALSGSSKRTQQRADKVAKADPALATKVAHGEVTLPAAVAKVSGKSKTTHEADPKNQHVVARPPNNGPSLTDLADIADELRIENETLRKQNDALSKKYDDNDLRNQLARSVQLIAHAQHEHEIAMDRAAKYQKEWERAVRDLRACAKAVGVNDPSHTSPRDIVKAVQEYARGRLAT